MNAKTQCRIHLPVTGMSILDSAEKASVHPSRPQDERRIAEKRWKIFPFVLRLVEAFFGLVSKINLHPRPTDPTYRFCSPANFRRS
jgi:hypothetical protein